MGKRAFLDPGTMRLKTWGYVLTNEVGDIPMDIAEDFDLEPSDGYRWDGTQFLPFPYPPPPEDPKKLALKDAANKASKDGDTKALAKALEDYLS